MSKEKNEYFIYHLVYQLFNFISKKSHAYKSKRFKFTALKHLNLKDAYFLKGKIFNLIPLNCRL